nr:MAG TPA: hypothetical protein [Caudoviricetes sp.]
MSNSNLTSYNFHNSDIRVVQNDKGEVLFCLADVCASLNLAQSNKTANQIKEEFGSTELNSALLKDANNHGQQCTMITEPQLYFVMMRSNSKVAREFRQWICNEVLPSIRAQGAYVANNTHVDDHEAEAESQKRCWYVKQLTDLCQKYNISDEALVAAVNIAQRAFKQGYAIALNKSTDTTDKQPKADDRLTITEDEATAIDHMIYFHDMFKPDVLQVFRKVTKLQTQLAALVCTIQDLPLARLYESATAPEVSCQRLKRFNTTKSKKGELVVSA